jgi:hypothetical protein
MSIGNATVAPTAGASSQVTYEFSLTQITATSINARSVRNFDQVQFCERVFENVSSVASANHTGIQFTAVLIFLRGGVCTFKFCVRVSSSPNHFNSRTHIFYRDPTSTPPPHPAPLRPPPRRQYVLPNVDATLTGVRAAVIIGLVAALFAGLNYLLLSQGWLQSTLSFEVAKQWYGV